MCEDSSIKVCTKCNTEKPIFEFPVRSSKCGKPQSVCKACTREKSKLWYQENKQRRYESSKRWRLENPERTNQKKRERRKRIADAKPKIEKPPFDPVQWRRDNKEKLRGYRQAWLAKHPMAAISDRYRRRLNGVLVGLGIRKIRTSSEFLGCTWSEFVAHIERQFLPGMTWENRGEWHIDHIVPIATAKTEEDVLHLNHYTNLRPLWAMDNHKKSGRVDFLI